MATGLCRWCQECDFCLEGNCSCPGIDGCHGMKEFEEDCFDPVSGHYTRTRTCDLCAEEYPDD